MALKTIKLFINIRLKKKIYAYKNVIMHLTKLGGGINVF